MQRQIRVGDFVEISTVAANPSQFIISQIDDKIYIHPVGNPTQISALTFDGGIIKVLLIIALNLFL